MSTGKPCHTHDPTGAGSVASAASIGGLLNSSTVPSPVSAGLAHLPLFIDFDRPQDRRRAPLQSRNVDPMGTPAEQWLMPQGGDQGDAHRPRDRPGKSQHKGTIHQADPQFVI